MFCDDALSSSFGVFFLHLLLAGLSAFFPKHRGVRVTALASLLQELTLSLTACYPGKGGRSCYQSVVQISWVIATRSEANGQYLFNYCALHSKEPLDLRTSLLLRFRAGSQFSCSIIDSPGSVILPSSLTAFSLEIATILPVSSLHREEVSGWDLLWRGPHSRYSIGYWRGDYQRDNPFSKF